MRTETPFKCPSCWQKGYFIIKIVEKDSQSYYLTQCPKCKSYDEVKKLTKDESKIYKITK